MQKERPDNRNAGAGIFVHGIVKELQKLIPQFDEMLADRQHARINALIRIRLLKLFIPPVIMIPKPGQKRPQHRPAHEQFRIGDGLIAFDPFGKIAIRIDFILIRFALETADIRAAE